MMFNTLGLVLVPTGGMGDVSVSHQGSVPQALGCVWSLDVVSTQAIKPGLFHSFNPIQPCYLQGCWRVTGSEESRLCHQGADSPQHSPARLGAQQGLPFALSRKPRRKKEKHRVCWEIFHQQIPRFHSFWQEGDLLRVGPLL